MNVPIEAFLAWEQRAEAQGAERAERSPVLRLLTWRVGEVPEAVRSQIEALLITQLELLGEALLDFTNLADFRDLVNGKRPLISTHLEEHPNLVNERQLPGPAPPQ